jgi:hypothetical protein
MNGRGRLIESDEKLHFVLNKHAELLLRTLELHATRLFFSRLDYSPGRIKTLSFLLGGTGPVLLFGSKDPLNMQGGS